jgi:predicted mannosyl-3-phosphoglycerate phosphatase (HAD superfamily)
MPFVEQMANIGSEVERALNWKARNNAAYCQQAFERALELIDLTLDDVRNHYRFKELARVREAIVDYFSGLNEFASTELLWKKYFLSFTYAARRNY